MKKAILHSPVCEMTCRRKILMLIKLLVMTPYLCCDWISGVLKMKRTARSSFSPASFTPGHLHIFTRSAFTLIELLVVIAQHCRHFFRGFICTDQYGCVRKHTESAALKNTPHHTCKASASCLPQANA
ncbi:MAG: prepilin-type N-terminal cleavage/methylation domain-containing protein, partial [Lentisphaeria bacterium]|nr:prepilin-type N-terminal cleavage/methylation domain-containing protein [Lentisphaeria bacterium]